MAGSVFFGENFRAGSRSPNRNPVTPMKTTDVILSTREYHDAISGRAREIWRARGKPHGEDVEIWLEAERDLVGRGLIPSAPPATAVGGSRTRMAADEIDERELSDRLSRIGGPGSRSPTSA
jgi:hypothetical protein